MMRPTIGDVLTVCGLKFAVTDVRETDFHDCTHGHVTYTHTALDGIEVKLKRVEGRVVYLEYPQVWWLASTVFCVPAADPDRVNTLGVHTQKIVHDALSALRILEEYLRAAGVRPDPHGRSDTAGRLACYLAHHIRP
jgi:hypothetical protein